MIISVCGFMASGKSTYGKQLANALSIDFIDLDTEIEKESGHKISDLFLIYGETYFRLLEQMSLHSVLKKNESCVLSLGGGTPFFEDNWKHIQEKTISVFLDLPFGMLKSRLQESPSKRPLFESLTEEALSALFDSRRETYLESKHCIDPNVVKASSLAAQLK